MNVLKRIGLLCLGAFMAQGIADTGGTVHIIINGQTFAAELADTDAARALRTLLPLTLHMQDHLGNEKFAALPRALPRADKAAGQIEAGEIKLWQGDTLVIFYDSFPSSYRYTPLAVIRAPQGLAQTLGTGDVEVILQEGREQTADGKK